MESKDIKNWKSSKNQGKQRKYLHLAPVHMKRKLLSARLSKTLKEKYGKRNIPVRKGDTVKIMIGEFKGKQGKVASVDIERVKLIIDGIQVTKKDGSKANRPIPPSNVQIIDLELSDKKREQALLRKATPKDENNKEGAEIKNG